VDLSAPASLLHPLLLRDGTHATVQVRSAGSRHFVLDPFPFDQPSLTFEFSARHVKGNRFTSSEALREAFQSAPIETLQVTVSSK
jgi:hypothetical protein